MSKKPLVKIDIEYVPLIFVIGMCFGIGILYLSVQEEVVSQEDFVLLEQAKEFGVKEEVEYSSSYLNPESTENYFLYGMIANKTIDELFPEDLNLSVEELSMFAIYACDGNREMASRILKENVGGR